MKTKQPMTAEEFLKSKGWDKENPTIGGAMFKGISELMEEYMQQSSIQPQIEFDDAQKFGTHAKQNHSVRPVLSIGEIEQCVESIRDNNYLAFTGSNEAELHAKEEIAQFCFDYAESCVSKAIEDKEKQIETLQNELKHCNDDKYHNLNEWQQSVKRIEQLEAELKDMTTTRNLMGNRCIDLEEQIRKYPLYVTDEEILNAAVEFFPRPAANGNKVRIFQEAAKWMRSKTWQGKEDENRADKPQDNWVSVRDRLPTYEDTNDTNQVLRFNPNVSNHQSAMKHQVIPIDHCKHWAKESIWQPLPQAPKQ